MPALPVRSLGEGEGDASYWKDFLPFPSLGEGGGRCSFQWVEFEPSTNNHCFYSGLNTNSSTMQFIDYYKILGLPKEADTKAIKAAYRKLARKHHPDLNPNDESAKKKFQQINEAHEVLSDPEKRKKYDKYGKDWEHADAFEAAAQQQRRGQSGRRAHGFEGFAGEGSFGQGEFSDFFEAMFGNMGGRTRYSQEVRFRGQDYNAVLRLHLRDVYKSQKQTLQVNGKNIRLTIPAGVSNGQTIKIKGHGGPGVNGGPNGDLYIKFEIINHTPFRRDGKNLYRTFPLDLYTAVMGGEIKVDTFDGKKVKLNVKPGTQNGTKIKLSGKGFPVYKKEGTFGDLILTYNIEIPTNLSAEERVLFEKLAKLRKS